MKKFSVNQARDFVGEKVVLQGWVFNKRSSGSIAFLQLRDGTGFMQAVVVKNEVSPESFQAAKEVTIESSVEVEGTIREEKRAIGGCELSVSQLKIISLAEEYPIGKKDHGPDFLLNNRHLWLRSKRQWAIQRIRNSIITAIYDHLQSEGFTKIDSPILTPSACEGTTTLFPVPYLPAWKDSEGFQKMIKEGKGDYIQFKGEPYAYLSQSGQLYLEAAIFAHGKVFDFGPTFRAEKSKTRRHLNEFWMMDAEMAFADHRENMKTQEKLIVAVVSNVLQQAGQELEILQRDTNPLKKIIAGEFPILSHQQATQILKKEGIAIGERDDFGAESETILSQKFDKPVFIEKYPKEIKAFYMKEDVADTSRVLNDDLIAPEGYGEIIGGSQREDEYQKLLGRMKENGLPLDDYQWYLDLRRYGSVPHSGFGVGLERLVSWICKLEHVRETIPFPRMLDRFKP